MLYPIQGHLQKYDLDEKLAFYHQQPCLSDALSNINIKHDTDGLVSMDFGHPPVYPNHQSFQMPNEAIFRLDRFSFMQVDEYEHALFKYGIVLIKPSFPDNKQVFFKALIKHIGIPLSHSAKGNDYMWNIRVKSRVDGPDNSMARSHTNHLFQMHSDASFEDKPPRFVLNQIKTI